MRSVFAYIWQRRWFRLLIVGTVVCALPMLHPFIRQAIFGPTIDGIPWCVWENDIRRDVDPDRGQDSWFVTTLKKLGLLERQEIGRMAGNSEALLPLYVQLADDRDVHVRRHALHQLRQWAREHEAESLPVFRRHLDDADPQSRLIAAKGTWLIAKDPVVKDSILPLCDNADMWIARDAVCLLSETAAGAPDLFDALAKHKNHPDFVVRSAAVSSMRHFGKRGLPIIRTALNDPDRYVRLSAIGAASELRQEAASLYPELQALQNHADQHTRRNAAHALYIMNPKQFPKPATWVD